MKRTLYIFCLPFIFSGCFNPKNTLLRPEHLDFSSHNSIYNFTLKSIDGIDIPLSNYKGKKFIILNVASKCGFTPQYADWQAFYSKYGNQIAILGFPANDFLGQEPGKEDEIKSFCLKNYGVTFQLFSKSHVKGKNKSALYTWLTDKKQNGWNSQAPTWNFCKYLIDENGELVAFFASAVKPDNPAFLKAAGLEH